MNKLRITLIFVILLFSYSSFAQPAKAIQKYDSLYHSCLDKGQDMYGCSMVYYNEMDSMLHVVYKMARVRLDTTVRKNLNREQRQWIADRDTYFKTLATKDYGTEGKDREMMMEDDKASYIRKRTIELLNRLTY